MAETILNITNADLLQKLNASYIDAEQKKALEPLIPNMNETEKGELIALIDKAKEEKDKAEPIYQENLRKLNKEYTGKLNQLVKEETKNTFNEFEEAEKKEEIEGIKSFETEIDAANQPSAKKPVAGVIEKTTAIAGKHGLRNLILFLTSLVLIAGILLFALSRI